MITWGLLAAGLMFVRTPLEFYVLDLLVEVPLSRSAVAGSRLRRINSSLGAHCRPDIPCIQY
jgi:hypothetical protein